MKDMRILGNMIEKLAADRKVPAEELAKQIRCTPGQVAQLFKGRLLLAFDQLDALAAYFQVPVDTLLNGDPEHYQKTVVDCMGEFSDEKHREEILDIIDDYLDLCRAVKA